MSSITNPFTIDNIPYGVIKISAQSKPRCATAFGDNAIQLLSYMTSIAESGNVGESLEFALIEHGMRDNILMDVFDKPYLNDFAALPRKIRIAFREKLQQDIKANAVPKDCFIPLKDVEMQLPMKIGGYSDFYCSLEHCKNVRIPL